MYPNNAVTMHAEFELCLECGARPEDILFAHPCKYPSHLRAAAVAEVNRATFDTECELRKVAEHHPTCGASPAHPDFARACRPVCPVAALPPMPNVSSTSAFTKGDLNTHSHREQKDTILDV